MVSEKTTEQSQNTKDIVVSGLLIALVFISTYFIQFHLPLSLNSGGLVHLGNTMLFSIAIVFGKKKGAVAGAFGMGLFDIIAGWALWAPCTFIVRGVQGYLIGLIANGNDRKGNSVVWNIVAISISSAWMIAGYFIYNIALYQNWAAALSSIPGDVLQTVIGIILGLPLVSALKRIKGVAL
ncbi:MAG: ECF transporter S component [Firmicutes bacterium]|nr:ECF transporter S component [Bacillota bacterium]